MQTAARDGNGYCWERLKTVALVTVAALVVLFIGAGDPQTHIQSLLRSNADAGNMHLLPHDAQQDSQRPPSPSVNPLIPTDSPKPTQCIPSGPGKQAPRKPPQPGVCEAIPPPPEPDCPPQQDWWSASLSLPGQPALQGIAVTDGPRWEAAPWDSAWRPSPPWWQKLDFFVPACLTPGCCCGRFAIAGVARDILTGNGVLVANGSAPSFSDVPIQLAGRGFLLDDAIQILRDAGFAPEFTVNIGAACGFGGYADPTWPAFMDPRMGGVLVDGQVTATLFAAYPLKRGNVRLSSGVYVDPVTFPSLLTNLSVPSVFTLLKLDIDSFDCLATANMLDAGFSPLLIFSEVNTVFPPPLRFAMGTGITRAGEAFDYSPAPAALDALPFGCSLSATADVLMPRGYVLVEVDGWDALWVRADAAHLFQPLPRTVQAAFDVGFAGRASSVPQCVQKSRSQKVYNRPIADLAERAKRIMGDESLSEAKRKVRLGDVLAQVRSIIDNTLVSRSTRTGNPPPYLLDVTGPADELQWRVGA